MNKEVIRQWIVMKFGGTSVSSSECWLTISQQATARMAEGKHVLIVVSALSGVTNLLTQLAEGSGVDYREQILSEVEARHRELLNSLGLDSVPEFERHWASLTDLVINRTTLYKKMKQLGIDGPEDSRRAG